MSDEFSKQQFDDVFCCSHIMWKFFCFEKIQCLMEMEEFTIGFGLAKGRTYLYGMEILTEAQKLEIFEEVLWKMHWPHQYIIAQSALYNSYIIFDCFLHKIVKENMDPKDIESCCFEFVTKLASDDSTHSQLNSQDMNYILDATPSPSLPQTTFPSQNEA